MKTIRSTNAAAAISARRACPPHSQQGVAAVEFALILTLVALLMTVPIYFGKVFSHYSVTQKAARDAAIYFATIPLASMSNKTDAEAAVAAAEAIVMAEVADLHPGQGQPVKVEVLCDNAKCLGGRPTNITVRVDIKMNDNDGWTAPLGAINAIDLSAVVEMTYLGK